MSASGNGSGAEASLSGDYNDSSDDYYDDYYSDSTVEFWYKVGENTIVYGLPVVIIAGTVGNVLSMVTFGSRQFRHAPCTVLLFILAVVDTLVLTYAGSYEWVVQTFLDAYKHLLFEHPRVYCAMLLVYNVVKTMSPWTVVLITFERFVSVMWPFRAGIICSKKKMVISWFVVLLVITLVYSSFPLTEFSNNADCRPSEDTVHYQWRTRFAVACIGPLVLIVGGNAGIIYKTCVASRNRKKTVDSSSSAAASAASDARSITIMLVVVCVVFLLTAYPYYVVFFVNVYYEYSLVPFAVMRPFTTVLYYLNSATNFLLYFTTGRLFRTAFLQMVCRCKRQTSTHHNAQRGLQVDNTSTQTTNLA